MAARKNAPRIYIHNIKLRVSEEQRERLATVEESTGRERSSLLREGVDMVLARYDPQPDKPPATVPGVNFVSPEGTQ